MYTGLVTGLGDPYTSYIPADDLQNFIDDTKRRICRNWY